MVSQLKIPLKPIVHHSTIELKGLMEALIIWPTFYQETPSPKQKNRHVLLLYY